MPLIFLAAASCGRLSPGPREAGQLGPATRAGRVYLVRGFLDWYSTGLDRLAAEVAAAGVANAAYREEQWGDLADALAEGPVVPGPVVLVGFSYGADDVILIARRMAARGRRVDLLVTIDPVTPAAVPANVRRCVSFYQPNGVWDALPLLRGVPLTADPGGPTPENVNVRARPDLDEPGISHATIADDVGVHRSIVGLIRATCPRVADDGRR